MKIVADFYAAVKCVCKVLNALSGVLPNSVPGLAVYRTFVDSLSDDLYYVNRKPDAKQRMVEMFHAGTLDTVKKHLLDNFVQ